MPMKCPPTHGQICGYEGALLTKSWPLPAASTKIKSRPLQNADLQHTLERSSGWRQKTRHSVLWEKPGKTGLQIVRCFQVKIFMNPNSCIFSYLVQFSSVTQSCLTLCDSMYCSMPGFPVHHQLLEFTQTHVYRVSDAIQASHPLSSPSPPAPIPPASGSFTMSQLFA